jgi:hypothetical protein
LDRGDGLGRKQIALRIEEPLNVLAHRGGFADSLGKETAEGHTLGLDAHLINFHKFF